VTNSEVRALWSTFMQKCVDNTRGADQGGTQARAAPDTLPAEDIATFLNLMNERAMPARSATKRLSYRMNASSDTLTHIWITSIHAPRLHSCRRRMQHMSCRLMHTSARRSRLVLCVRRQRDDPLLRGGQ